MSKDSQRIYLVTAIVCVVIGISTGQEVVFWLSMITAETLGIICVVEALWDHQNRDGR